MKVFVIEQIEFNEDTNLYDVSHGAVEVFTDKHIAQQFIKSITLFDKDEGLDYTYNIKEFEI